MVEDDKIETGQAAPSQEPFPENDPAGAPENDNQDEPPYANAPTTESFQARETTETYQDYRRDRAKLDHTWWGDRQYEPGLSDPDRQFMFARNAPISDQEIQDAQMAYNDSIIDPETGNPNPLGSHLRPTTPPLERAEKQVQHLRDLGVDVPPELEKEIFGHFATNSGLDASLMEWCEGKDVVPIEHVREIIKIMDRLKLEMAKQMRDAAERLNRKNKEYNLLHQQYERLQTEKYNRNRETESQVQTKRQRRYSLVEFRGVKLRPTEFGELMDKHTRTIKTHIVELHENDKKVKMLEEKVETSQNRIKTLEKVNFATADSLINAVRNQDNGPNGTEELSLMDRINYLNLACFFRTRNYVQLALREGADRLANILLYDVSKWVKFCREDFEKMDPGVNTQIKASICILNGVRRVLTAKDEEAVSRGRRALQYGQRVLLEFPDTLPFTQLEQLADCIIETTQDDEGNILYKKRLRFSFQKGFGVEKKPKAKVQERIRNDRFMKAKELRRSGFHSPLSPEIWSTENPGVGFDLEDISE